MIAPTDILYAQKLRSLRMGKAFKQSIVYKSMGFNSQQEYSKLENGKIHFTDAIIDKVSQPFNISPEDFTKPQELVHKYRRS